MSNLSSNDFARLLIIYENYKRSRLNTEDLRKIANKYSCKPQKLLTDLNKKYPRFKQPLEVKLVDIERLKSLYEIPLEFSSLLPNVSEIYDKALDIRSQEFNAEKAFAEKHIISSIGELQPYDNITKVKHLVFKEDKSQDTCIKTESVLPVSQQPSLLLPTSNNNTRNKEESISLSDSPFALLHLLMKDKVKVRIIIRRLNSLRGTVEGYLRAFDKHFNLVLTDVDERYSIPGSSSSPLLKTKPVTGNVTDNVTGTTVRPGRPERELPSSSSSSSASGAMKYRHLPQILIRGDNVVLICRANR
eukprot:gene5104-10217_t